MAAGDAVVKGTNAFTEQPKTRKWIKGRGWVRVRTFEGPFSDSLIDAQVAALTAVNAEEIEVAEGHPTVITAMIPNDSDSIGVGLADPNTQTEWSLDPYDLDKTLASHGAFNLSGSSASALIVIEKEIKSAEAYGKDYNTLYPSIGAFNNYVLLRGAGTDSFLSHGFILRAVMDCERGNVFVREQQQKAVNAGKIITWDKIGVPDDALIVKPKVHVFAGYELSGTGFIDLDINEWYVKPLAIRFSRRGKTRLRQLVQEYIGAWKWSATLYDGGTGVP